MQTSYGEMAPNYSDVLKTAITVWHNKEENQTYGFPMTTPWGEVAYPLLANRSWEFLGVLPAGMPISNIATDKGERVRCDVGGKRIITALMVVHR